MDLHFLIGEPHVWIILTFLFALNLNMLLPKLNISRNMSMKQNAAREQYFDVQLHRLDIERVRRVKNHRFMSAFFAK